MDLRQLEYLVAVVDDGGFTRAAERLHVAQPGVSAALRRLEAELGEQLLDRGARAVTPTAAGAALLPHARAALAAVAAGRDAVDELRGLVRGRVAIGVVTACPAIELAAPLAAFHAAHPGVEVSLEEDGSDRLVAGLRDGRLDLAVIGAHGPPLAGLDTLTLVDEPLVAVVAPDDPLAGRGRGGARRGGGAGRGGTGRGGGAGRVVALTALRDRPLVMLPRGTGVRAAFEAGCAQAGFEPHVAFEASSPALVASLARRGLGAAIVARSMAALDPELAVVELTRPALRSRLELAWRADGPSSPAARALTADLCAALT